MSSLSKNNRVFFNKIFIFAFQWQKQLPWQCRADLFSLTHLCVAVLLHFTTLLFWKRAYSRVSFPVYLCTITRKYFNANSKFHSMSHKYGLEILDIHIQNSRQCWIGSWQAKRVTARKQPNFKWLGQFPGIFIQHRQSGVHF